MALFFVKSSKLYVVIYTLRVIGPNTDYANKHTFINFNHKTDGY